MSTELIEDRIKAVKQYIDEEKFFSPISITIIENLINKKFNMSDETIRKYKIPIVIDKTVLIKRSKESFVKPQLAQLIAMLACDFMFLTIINVTNPYILKNLVDNMVNDGFQTGLYNDIDYYINKEKDKIENFVKIVEYISDKNVIFSGFTSLLFGGIIMFNMTGYRNQIFKKSSKIIDDIMGNVEGSWSNALAKMIMYKTVIKELEPKYKYEMIMKSIPFYYYVLAPKISITPVMNSGFFTYLTKKHSKTYDVIKKAIEAYINNEAPETILVEAFDKMFELTINVLKEFKDLITGFKQILIDIYDKVISMEVAGNSKISEDVYEKISNVMKNKNKLAKDIADVSDNDEDEL